MYEEYHEGEGVLEDPSGHSEALDLGEKPSTFASSTRWDRLRGTGGSKQRKMGKKTIRLPGHNANKPYCGHRRFKKVKSTLSKMITEALTRQNKVRGNKTFICENLGKYLLDTPNFYTKTRESKAALKCT